MHPIVGMHHATLGSPRGAFIGSQHAAASNVCTRHVTHGSPRGAYIGHQHAAASHCLHAPRHTRVPDSQDSPLEATDMMVSEVAFKKMPEHDLSKLSADKSVWVREL